MRLVGLGLGGAPWISSILAVGASEGLFVGCDESEIVGVSEGASVGGFR